MSETGMGNKASYDAIVLGGGLAGYPAAIEMSRRGLKVAIVEEKAFGGECTNHGCIPSKALLHAARLVFESRRVPGLSVGLASWRELVEWRRGIVRRLSQGIEFLLKSYGATIYRDRGIVDGMDGEDILVRLKGDNRVLRARNLLIATGTRPALVKGVVVDGQRVHDNRSILELGEPPRSIIVIGAGAVGVEYATALAMLGAQVTLVEALPQVLPGVDRDLAKLVERGLKKLGVRIMTNAPVELAWNAGGKAHVSLKGGEELEAEHVLVAVGRTPNTDGLGLEKLGVELDERGYVRVDPGMRTSNPRVYAAGDVTGPPLLAHKAYAQSLVAAENILERKAVFDQLVPNVVYSEPEVASVGLTLEQAREQGFDAGVETFRYAALSRALIESGGEGMIKVVYDRGDKTLLGVHIAGAHADDLIAEATLAMEMNATLEDLSLVVHPHPSMSEALREVAEMALGRPIHFYKKPQPRQ